MTSIEVLMPIAFHDEFGACWTVAPQPALRADEPSHTTLVFTGESGERRISDACLPEGSTWEDVEERVWAALLRYSAPAADRPGFATELQQSTS